MSWLPDHARPARLLLLLLLSFPLAVHAGTIRVPVDAPTIAMGLAAAASGDTVEVACGTYLESALVVPSGVVLRSADVTADCVTIDAGHAARVLTCTGPSPIRIEGLTIRGGQAADSTRGGGAWVRAGAAVTFAACRFEDNEAFYGGALSADSADVTLTACVFEGNAARAGAATWAFGGRITATGCTFHANTAGTSGGAMYVRYTTVDLADCTVSGDPHGNAADMADGTVHLSVCRFEDNEDEGLRAARCTLSMEDCTFARNWNLAFSTTSTTLVATRVEFTDNGLVGRGGALSQYYGSTTATDCVFRNNATNRRGGAWKVFEGTVIVQGGLFEGNRGGVGTGGAVHGIDASGTFSGTVFRGNSAQNAGAIYWSGAPLTMVDCTFQANEAYRAGTLLVRQTSASIERCLFRDNAVIPFFGDEGEGSCLIGERPGTTTLLECTLTGGTSLNGAVYAEDSHRIRLNRTIVAFVGGAGYSFIRGGRVEATCSDLYGNQQIPWPDGVGDVLPDGVGNFSADPGFCDAAAGDYGLRGNSLCSAARSPCGLRVGRFDVACPAVGVYVAASGGGVSVYGDGVARMSAALFDWAPGTAHDIAVDEVAESNAGVQYSFRDWTDGGARVHGITVQSTNDYYLARQDSLFRFEMRTAGGGTGNPASSWHTPGSAVEISATADWGFAFGHWRGIGTGSYTGPEPDTLITLQRPVAQTAHFLPGIPINVISAPSGLSVRVDGRPYTTPAEVSVPINSYHLVEMDSLQTVGAGHRVRFQSWNLGPVPRAAVYTTDQPLNIQATFTHDYTLTFSPPGVGFTPAAGWYPAGTPLTITATPPYGQTFRRWVGTGTGSYTGPDNPANIEMWTPIHQQAELRPTYSGHGLQMTVSASDVDPFVSSSASVHGPRNLYLWLTCAEVGISALEMSVTGNFTIFGFTPGALVLNAGTPRDLLVAIGGCPTGNPVQRLLGYWTVWDDGGTFCVGPSPGGVFATVDCQPVVPNLWPSPVVTGFTSNGTTPCTVGTNLCETPTLLALSGLSAVAGDHVVRLSWFAPSVTDPRDFRVYRRETGAASFELRPEQAAPAGDQFEWTDSAAEGDRTYEYELGWFDGGTELRFGPVQVTTPDWAPRVTALTGIRPNPASGSVELRFTLASRSTARLDVFDVAGRRVTGIVDGPFDAGDHGVTWDGRTGDHRLSSGIYFVRLRVGDQVWTRKLTWVDGS